MQKARALGFVLAAMLVSAGIAEGMTITEVEVAQNITLSYASGSGVLTYDVNDDAQAQVTFDDNTIEVFTSVDISSTLTLTTDTSSLGEASGTFLTGAISVQISGPLGLNPNSDVSSITLEGTVSWFNLQANNGLPNPTLNSEGVFTLTTANVVSPTHGIIWDSQCLGILRTTHHSLMPAAPADLSGNISSTSGSLAVFAWDPILSINCYGLDTDDPTVCSGHGRCVHTNVCCCDQGWTGEACEKCVYQVKGDLNEDCVVNLVDFAKFASVWLVNCLNDPGNTACVTP